MKTKAEIKRRTGTLGLILAILLGLLPLIASCKPEPGNEPATEGTGQQTAATEPVSTAEVDTAPTAEEKLKEAVEAIGQRQMDYTVRIATSNQVNNVLEIIQAPTEENEGDLINDALVRRDAIIEERLGVEIEYKMFGDDPYELLDKPRTSITAGQDEYDVIIGDMYNVAKGLLNAGYLVPMETVPSVDLNNPWWSESATRDLSINGKVYFATGDITPRYVLSPYILMFNKYLFDLQNIEYPYDDVMAGTWTVDGMLSIIKDTYADRNENSASDEGDFFGLACDSTAAYAFFRGCDVMLVSLDSSGKPISNADTELLDRITSYLGTSLGGNENVFMGTASYQETTIFKEGRSLFVGNTLTNIYLYNDMTDPYGILPMPKYESAQEYCSYGQPWGAVSVLIPTSCQHLEEVGAIVESMSMISKYTSTVAALDKTLMVRKTHDEESEATLNIIFSTLSYDLGTIFRWGGVYQDLLDSIRLNESFITTYAGKVDAVNAQIGVLLKRPAFKSE